MSAIACVLSYTDPLVSNEFITRLTIAGMRRGRDIAVVKILGQVALGIALLRITNEDYAEDQPIGDHSVGVWTVLDGRLDNRDELLCELGVAPGTPQMSDCRIAHLAYQQWGRDCAEKLIGSFALIVSDSRRDLVFCAIDHIGSRPLFFSQSPQRIIVASTIQQLLYDKSVSREIDDTYMLATLCFPSSPPLWTRHTPYKAIQRLLPGHTLTIYVDGRCQTVRYWHPENLPMLYDTSEFDLAEKVRHTFTEVVKSQLRSAKSVMPTFSGGLDSSSITCTAAMLRDTSSIPCRGLRPCTLTFAPGTESDEHMYRQDAIEQYALDVVHIPGDEVWHLSDILGGAPLPDEPFGSFVAWREIQGYAMAARESDCNVVLFGHGGDEFMGGGEYYLADSLKQGRLRELIAGINSVAHLPNTTYFSAFYNYALLPLLPSWLWRCRTYAYHKSGRWDCKAEWYRPMVPPWLSVTQCKRFGVLDEIWNDLPERWSPLPSRAEQMNRLRQNIATTWFDDYVFMPEGCEARAPFFDRRFIELALQIPDFKKTYIDSEGRVSKLVLRRAMKGILPDKIRTRRDKTSFNARFSLGLRHEWATIVGQREFAVVERGLVKREQLHAALQLWRLGQWDYLGQILSLLIVEHWLRRSDQVATSVLPEHHRHHDVYSHTTET